ncbi:FimV/HubP family polar landmark protein [Glaciimonas sp. GG7]
MPHNKRLNPSSKLISAGLKTLSSAVISATVLMAGAHAASLGKITILSSLGQPLKAEIELTSVSKDEESQLVAKLASVDAYKQANIDFNPALLSLQFSIDQRGLRKFVRVTSTQPINEPFVAVLMELGGTKTRVIREYNVLLDPADSRIPQAAQITTPERVGSSSSASTATPLASATNTTALLSGARNDRLVYSPPPRSTEKKLLQTDRAVRQTTKIPEAIAATSAKTESDYLVKKGDTLSHIAIDNLPTGVSLDQMLVAMYRSNENAFIANNINRLRSGQILSIPSANNARAVTRSEASNIILSLSKDFNGYRDILANQTAKATPHNAVDANQSAGGKITTKVEEQANPANDAKDKLKLSRPGDDLKSDTKLVAATEEQISREKAAIETSSRVKELEKNISDLQKILDVKNKSLDELQKQTSASGENAATPATETASGKQATTTSVETTSAKPVIKPATPKVAAAKPPEPSFLGSLADSPLSLSIAGVLALLLAGLGIHRFRRNKQQVFLDSGEATLTNSGLRTNSLFGSTGGRSVDTKNSIFNSSFVPSVSNLDTNVDPVAEADVYIAYGRDVQAEEILKEALRSQPNRHAIRVKLLEIYAARKDVRAFGVLANELYSLTNGAGEEWQEAIALGFTIDPTNPLYGKGLKSEQVVTNAVSMTEPNPLLDDLNYDGLNAVTEPFIHAVDTPLESAKEVAELFAPLNVDDSKPDLVIAPSLPASSWLAMETVDLELDKSQVAQPYKYSPIDLDVETLSDEITSPASVVTEKVAMAKPLEFDLSGMDLNLDVVEDTHAHSHENISQQIVIHVVNAEMATKLDLAVAYQEIGDIEGARELLEEVLKGGDLDQIDTAKSLLTNLA